jgi:hypothetical protein
MAHDFLKTPGATHLMFIDADVAFDGADVVRMLDKQLKHGFDLVAGLYPKKSIFWEGVADAARQGADARTIESAGAKFPFNLKSPNADQEAIDGCVEVLDAPTGFMLIPKSTLEKVILTQPNDWYQSDSESDYGEPVYNLFETLDVRTEHPGQYIQGRRKLSEDYAFCRKAQHCGLRIFVDTTIELKHWGTHRYAGRVADLVESVTPVVSPTVQIEGAA